MQVRKYILFASLSALDNSESHADDANNLFDLPAGCRIAAPIPVPSFMVDIPSNGDVPHCRHLATHL